MPKTNNNNKKGFTIIEVVLVLAIAGLIFLMVFIAFPALQRSQRDTQRTDDMGRVQSSLMNWQNNHSNNLPRPEQGQDYVKFDTSMIDDDGVFNDQCKGSACQFIHDYMNSAATQTAGRDSIDTFKDPSGEFYNLVITKNISGNGDPISSIPFHNDVTDADMKLTIDNSITDNTAYTLEGMQDAYVMFVIPGATCDEDKAIKSTKNNFAILYRMEGSGIKCTNNGT